MQTPASLSLPLKFVSYLGELLVSDELRSHVGEAEDCCGGGHRLLLGRHRHIKVCHLHTHCRIVSGQSVFCKLILRCAWRCITGPTVFAIAFCLDSDVTTYMVLAFIRSKFGSVLELNLKGNTLYPSALQALYKLKENKRKVTPVGVMTGASRPRGSPGLLYKLFCCSITTSISGTLLP